MQTITRSRSLVLLAAITMLVVHAVPSDAGTTGQTAGHAVRLSVREVARLRLLGPRILWLDPGCAGEGSMLLQYTTINPPGEYRTISVQWRDGDRAPSGTSLRLIAARLEDGCGRTDGEITVSGRPTAVISRIPSCATGRATSGALLRYRLSVDDPVQARDAGSAVVTLVFTIGDR